MYIYEPGTSSSRKLYIPQCTVSKHCVWSTVPGGPEVNVNTVTLKVKLKEALRRICIYFYIKYYTMILYKPIRIVTLTRTDLGDLNIRKING